MTISTGSETLRLGLNSRSLIPPNAPANAFFEQQKHIDKLTSLYEKEHLSNLTLRETVRKLRQSSSLTARQVQLANRTIERLAIDRGSTEAQDAAKDACIRRLQTQVAVLSKRGELNETAEELSCEMAERVVRLGLELDAEKAQRETLEKAVRDLEEDNRKLKRAVQVASEVQVAAEGASEEREAVHKANNNKLLLAVAKAQEEAIGLAKELAAAKNERETMEGALKTARDHLTKQHEALQRWKEFEISHGKKERSLADEVASLKEVVAGMEGERKARRQLEDKVRGLISEVEVERTRRMEAEARLKVYGELTERGRLTERGELTARGLAVKDEEGEKVERQSAGKNSNDPSDKAVIDLHATVGPEKPAEASCPTLFELANMQVSM